MTLVPYAGYDRTEVVYEARPIIEVYRDLNLIRRPRRVRTRRSPATPVDNGANSNALARIPVSYGKLRMRRAFQLICALHRVEPADFFDRCRSPQLANARCLMCRLLSKAGMSQNQIGRLINRDSTTVLYYLHGRKPK